MVALYKLAEQVEQYKTNLNGGHFTLKRTMTVNNPLQQLTDVKGGPSHTAMLPNWSWQTSAVRLKAEGENNSSVISLQLSKTHIVS